MNQKPRKVLIILAETWDNCENRSRRSVIFDKTLDWPKEAMAAWDGIKDRIVSIQAVTESQDWRKMVQEANQRLRPRGLVIQPGKGKHWHSRSWKISGRAVILEAWKPLSWVKQAQSLLKKPKKKTELLLNKEITWNN